MKISCSFSGGLKFGRIKARAWEAIVLMNFTLGVAEGDERGIDRVARADARGRGDASGHAHALPALVLHRTTELAARDTQSLSARAHRAGTIHSVLKRVATLQ